MALAEKFREAYRRKLAERAERLGRVDGKTGEVQLPLNEQGAELPDPTPMEVPLQLQRQESQFERMRNLIRGEISRQAGEQGFETFEESEDFEEVDPDEVPSKYENEGLSLDELNQRAIGEQMRQDAEREVLARRLAANRPQNPAEPLKSDPAGVPAQPSAPAPKGS